jgi:hypothetical protein
MASRLAMTGLFLVGAKKKMALFNSNAINILFDKLKINL